MSKPQIFFYCVFWRIGTTCVCFFYQWHNVMETLYQLFI